MEPMSKKLQAVNVLITNIPIAISLCITAQLLTIGKIIPPMFAINFCLAYAISFLIGMLIPFPKWGVGFAFACKAKPDSLVFGLLVNLIINTGYVVILSICISYFNICIMNHAPFMAFVMGTLSTFVPIWLVSYIVSFVWNKPAMAIAKKICGE